MNGPIEHPLTKYCKTVKVPKIGLIIIKSKYRCWKNTILYTKVICWGIDQTATRSAWRTSTTSPPASSSAWKLSTPSGRSSILLNFVFLFKKIGPLVQDNYKVVPDELELHLLLLLRLESQHTFG